MAATAGSCRVFRTCYSGQSVVYACTCVCYRALVSKPHLIAPVPWANQGHRSGNLWRKIAFKGRCVHSRRYTVIDESALSACKYQRQQMRRDSAKTTQEAVGRCSFRGFGRIRNPNNLRCSVSNARRTRHRFVYLTLQFVGGSSLKKQTLHLLRAIYKQRVEAKMCDRRSERLLLVHAQCVG